MASSLIGGLLSDGLDSAWVTVSDTNKDRLQHLKAATGISVTTDNNAAIEQADVVILAVKPQLLSAVVNDMSASIQKKKPLLITIAAGIRSADINRWAGGNCAIVRCMPNTPALVQAGASALFANQEVSREQREVAEIIMRAVGLALWVKQEEQMDAVTAISGSGPAYFFLVIEAMQSAGESLGLPSETASLLAIQTAFGAAKMALESEDDAATLRRKVTSPGGTTEQAINTLEEGNLRQLFQNALKSASDRSKQMAEQFGKTTHG